MTRLTLVLVGAMLNLVGCQGDVSGAAIKSPSVDVVEEAGAGELSSDFAWTVSNAAIARVKDGLSEEEVRKILGNPPTVSTQNRRDGRKIVTWSYRRETPLERKKTFIVFFERGVVTSRLPMPEYLEDPRTPDPKDSKFTWTLSEEQVAKIKIGMTEEEVRALVGTPPEVMTSHTKEGRSSIGWGYGFARQPIPIIYIFFEHGRVTAIR